MYYIGPPHLCWFFVVAHFTLPIAKLLSAKMHGHGSQWFHISKNK